MNNLMMSPYFILIFNHSSACSYFACEACNSGSEMITYQNNILKIMQNVESKKVCKNNLHARVVRVNIKARRDGEMEHAKNRSSQSLVNGGRENEVY